MGKSPQKPELIEAKNPSETVSVVPQDLHNTSDIRFVMGEVSKLSVQVEHLAKTIDHHSSKIEKLRDQATFLKASLWTASILIPFFIAIAGWILYARFDELVKSLQPLLAHQIIDNI